MTSSIFAHIFYNNCRKPFNIYVTHDTQSQKPWKICFTTSLSYQTLKASVYKLLRLQSIELCAIIKWVCCIVSFNLRWTTQHYEHSYKLMNYTWSQYCFFFSNKYDALRDLGLFVQQPATLLQVSLLHGYFSRFLNCTNGTKLPKSSRLVTPCSFEPFFPNPNIDKI